MDVSKLHEGMVIQNFKELCYLLGTEPKPGNSRYRQLSEIERYVSYHKDKYKFIIDEIYDNPKEKKGNKRNSVYVEMLELAIMDFLIKSKRTKTTATKNYLLGQVELINQNYRLSNSNRLKFAKYIGVDVGIVNDFFNISGGNFRKILERSLDSLDDKAILKYSMVTIISYNYKSRKATFEELDLILESERIVINQLGYEKKSHVRVSGKWFVFKNEVKKLLYQKGARIDFYYTSYEITMNTKFIKEEREKVAKYIVDEFERVENRDMLTDTLSDNLINGADNRQQKARKSTNMNKYNQKARVTFTYVKDVQKIVRYVINPYSKGITQDIIND